MIKTLIFLFIFTIVTLLAAGAFNVSQNNRNIEWPDRQQIDFAFDQSIKWLQTNSSKIERQHNPALWWMLKEASDISTNNDLKKIYNNYKKNYLDKNPLNIWSPYFSEYYKPRAPDIHSISNLKEYQIFFIYALSCDKDLETESVVQKQFLPDYCTPPFIYARCTTHQQMGVRLLQKHNCGNQERLSNLSTKLIEKIHNELFWDFRVGDAYLQRSLMIAEAGRIDLLKPVWIQRILEAQNPDGGWDDIYPIFKFNNDKIFGLSSSLPVLRKAKSTFHATAQAIWLLSLLQKHSTLENNI